MNTQLIPIGEATELDFEVVVVSPYWPEDRDEDYFVSDLAGRDFGSIVDQICAA